MVNNAFNFLIRKEENNAQLLHNDWNIKMSSVYFKQNEKLAI